MEPGIANDVQSIGRIDAVPRILQAVTHLTGLRFTAVARVTDDSWTACAVHDLVDFGMQPGGQLALETTFCDQVRQYRKPVVFGHASQDPDYSGHPSPKMYGFESYISIPILRVDGSFFGTLCALDPLPAKLDDPSIVRTLELFAQLIGSQMDLQDRLEHSTGALRAAEDVAKLREQFIAVLGHDLQSPLLAMTLGTEMLREAPLNARWERHLDRMQLSCVRMNDLIHDILDFARGRLGGGIPLTMRSELELEPQLRQVVSEVQSGHPGRRIELDLSLRQPVVCDDRRIGQLLGNLLLNAVTHGGDGEPINVRVRSDAGQLQVVVENRGQPIAEDIRVRLFEPFWRAHPDRAALGLGLGLYIAAEIAKAHGGTLAVESSAPAGTQFVFRMPLAPAAAP